MKKIVFLLAGIMIVMIGCIEDDGPIGPIDPIVPPVEDSVAFTLYNTILTPILPEYIVADTFVTIYGNGDYINIIPGVTKVFKGWEAQKFIGKTFNIGPNVLIYRMWSDKVHSYYFDFESIPGTIEVKIEANKSYTFSFTTTFTPAPEYRPWP